MAANFDTFLPIKIEKNNILGTVVPNAFKLRSNAAIAHNECKMGAVSAFERKNEKSTLKVDSRTIW